MKQLMLEPGNGGNQDRHAALLDVAGSIVQALERQPHADSEPLQALEKMKESLVFAYLTANLDIKNLPLKVFLDGFEKNILLACLRLTHGNQRDAAALLSLKPTALFEKMRKHGIRRQRRKLLGEPWDLFTANSDN